MEMPDVIYAAEYFDIDSVSLKEWREKSITGSEKYHHDRVLKAKDAEIEALHREIDENHKALRRWADSHEELRLEVELRAEIAKLEAMLEAWGYDTK